MASNEKSEAIAALDSDIEDIEDILVTDTKNGRMSNDVMEEIASLYGVTANPLRMRIRNRGRIVPIRVRTKGVTGGRVVWKYHHEVGPDDERAGGRSSKKISVLNEEAGELLEDESGYDTEVYTRWQQTVIRLTEELCRLKPFEAEALHWREEGPKLQEKVERMQRQLSEWTPLVQEALSNRRMQRQRETMLSRTQLVRVLDDAEAAMNALELEKPYAEKHYGAHNESEGT